MKLTPSTAMKAGLPQPPRVDDPQVLGLDDGRLAALVGRARPRRSECGRCPAQARDGGEQLLGVVVLRRGEQRPDVGLLDDLALVHDRDAVGEVGDDAHVVRDQHDRGAELVAAARSRSRISACTVTSRAVVGSSAMIRPGFEHQRLRR